MRDVLNNDNMYNVRKLIEQGDDPHEQQALSHLLGRNYGDLARFEPNRGKEPIKLNLHINNYGTELGKLREN